MMNEQRSPPAIYMVYQVANRLAWALRLIAAICLGLMVSVTMAEILVRNFLLLTVPWATEFARTLFIWSVMFGIAVVTHDKAHIAVTILTERGHEGQRKSARLVAIIAIIALSAILAVEGSKFVMINLDNFTPSLEISLGVATGGIAAGGIFILLFALLALLEELIPDFRRAREQVRGEAAS